MIVGALDGVLRVHDRATGKVVWSYDTTQPIRGMNGVDGHGGSMNAQGPVAQDGMAFKWSFPLTGTYWDAADILVQHVAKKEGGLDKLKATAEAKR